MECLSIVDPEVLRSGQLMGWSRQATTKGQGRGMIKDAVPISERPVEAEDRAVPGHGKGDLLAGSGNTRIATLLERRSRFATLVKVGSKDTQTVVKALERRVRTLPSKLRKTLTLVRGTEMAAHGAFAVATDPKDYFCDPQSPWQRGTNEHTNGPVRQYFPKGTDLSDSSQAQLDSALVGEALVGEARLGEARLGEAHAGEAHAGEAHAGEAHAGEAHAGERCVRVACATRESWVVLLFRCLGSSCGEFKKSMERRWRGDGEAMDSSTQCIDGAISPTRGTRACETRARCHRDRTRATGSSGSLSDVLQSR